MKSNNRYKWGAVLCLLFASLPAAAITVAGRAVVLRDPVPNISHRDLFYGSGGKEHEPRGKFTFIEEDLHGTNPKIVIQDQSGVKWTAKPGREARPETAASRLVWAVGYFTNDDYFLRDLIVENLPDNLHRGEKLIVRNMQDTRLKRHVEGEKKIGSWQWRTSPFAGTQEFNGLRVLMALMNNWDLTDENTA